MANLEDVERLREKANVTFSEAKDALENSGGDILDALIYLENQGKATVPPGGGYFSSGADTASGQSEYKNSADSKKGESFFDMLKRFGKFCLKIIDKGNNNYLDATKDGQAVFSCPVTAVVLLAVCFFWITIPLFVISLFLGFRYRFRGAELGSDAVNRVMDSASNVVDDVKKSFSEKE